MLARSSRPQRSPRRLLTQRERRIVALRATRRWGPARIGVHLRMAPSTVYAMLRRFQLPRLADLDRGTGGPLRRPRRYERACPGELEPSEAPALVRSRACLMDLGCSGGGARF